MENWAITGVTVDDAPALARNNGTAFWEEPMWRMLWPKDKSREFIIENLAKILQRRLISDRETTRHQKLVDRHTGSLLGYSRWRFPEPTTEWLEAQVPDTDSRRKRQILEAAESTWWEPRQDLEPLDSKNDRVAERILAERPYLSEFVGKIAALIFKWASNVGEIELDYLAVHPEHQGQGVATTLVRAGILEAERIGLPIFVFAYRAARSIYLKLGFTEVASVFQDDTAYGGCGEYAVFFMVYDVDPTDSD